MGFDENEISANAFGGTEIAKRSLAERLDPALLDQTQIICSRVRELDPTKIRVLWLHDLPEDPESAKLRDESYRAQFHHMVFISHWQYERYRLIHGIPYKHSHSILETAIEPAPSFDKTHTPLKGVVRLVYTSTPQRGLELLLPVYDALTKVYPNLHLNVYSSFKIYGWEDRDKQYEPLYDFCRNHPKISYHGFLPNDVLKSHLQASHIFAYPSIWPETSCRAMLEAMSARLLCVHPNFAGLSDTSGHLNLMYQGDEDPKIHMQIFYGALEAAIQRCNARTPVLENHLDAIKSYTDTRFGFPTIVPQWNGLLRNLVEMYPTVESRAIPKVQEPVFRYTV